MDTRRDFLKKASALAVAGTMPDSIQKAMAIDPAPGSTFLDAEHVVIERTGLDPLSRSLHDSCDPVVDQRLTLSAKARIGAAQRTGWLLSETHLTCQNHDDQCAERTAEQAAEYDPHVLSPLFRRTSLPGIKRLEELP